MADTIVNPNIKGINNMTILKMQQTKYRVFNYFQANQHYKLFASLFLNSKTLSSLREMLFLSLRSIYLNMESTLTVLQWMQPPIRCNSTLKKDQKYLKAIAGAQGKGDIGMVPENIFIIEIERFLKVIQYSNQEITLKILFELGLGMNCLIQGKQEYILYDKFFAYLYHQFNSIEDTVTLSQQQIAFLQKNRKEKLEDRIDQENGVRKLGIISDSNYSEKDEFYYDSVENLLFNKGPQAALDYEFIGFRFNDRNFSVNAIYFQQQQKFRLYLRTYPVFSTIQNQQTEQMEFISKTHTLQSDNNNIIDQKSHHMQTGQADESSYRFEFEANEAMDFELDYEGIWEFDFSKFDPETSVQFQVYSINSECVAGIKFTFPEERSSFPLKSFPCLEPDDGLYDCHTYLFKPLRNLKGFRVEKVQLSAKPYNIVLIKNFILLVKDNKKDKNKLLQYEFAFQKNQTMSDISNLHDIIMPYYNDDWRKVKFTIYFNFHFNTLQWNQVDKVKQKLSLINYALQNMFPNIELIENKKNLIPPNVFEIYSQSSGIYSSKIKDNYNRYVFYQLDQWSKVFDKKVIIEILDKIQLFIWSVGGAKSVEKLQLL